MCITLMRMPQSDYHPERSSTSGGAAAGGVPHDLVEDVGHDRRCDVDLINLDVS